MLREHRAEPVLDAPRCQHGEGPVWDARRGVLTWVDLLAGLVHRASVDADVRHVATTSVEGTVGAALPAAAGGAVLLSDDGFAHLADDGSTRRLLDLPTERRGITRMNDGACDPAGRLWAGTMAFDAGEGRGSLYRTDLDGSTSRVVPGMTIANGIGWSPDARTMLVVDSGPRIVWAWDQDPDDGAISRRRPLVEIGGPAAPDGLVMDDDGCAWVAMWGGGAVHRYAPDGRLVGVVRLPVSQPSSAAFAGPDRRTLVISTSREGLDEARLAREPLAGLLFAVDVGVAGPAATPFGGPIDGWTVA